MRNILYYCTGFAIIISYFFVLYVIAFVEIPTHNKEIFIHILGIIEGSFVTGLVGTFFTSSKREHEAGTVTETETVTETKQP
jgi:hypothetical protein